MRISCRSIAVIALVCACTALAQSAKTAQPTIDLQKYRDVKKYSYVEKAYTIGTHSYTLVNIKPKTASDTTCITAIVIDKRKYVLVDLQAADAPHGLVVPPTQPIDSSLLVVKVSPIDAKTFVILRSGKMATLPGDRLIIDAAGSTILSVWDNQGQCYLTVFDYRKLNLMVAPVAIAKPTQWFTNGLAWYFKADDGRYFTLDLFTKTVTAVAQLEKGLEEITYTFDPSTLQPAQCCGAQALGAK